jgi:BolA family transcriptional regulator, general stress-responsive regulator
MTAAMRTDAEGIAERLRAAFPPAPGDPLPHIDVRDDSVLHAGHAGAREGGHFAVRLTSPRFAGLSRVARHRLVYHALGPLPALGIHALAIEALAPGER